MKIVGMVAVMLLLAGPAWAQSQPMQKYGDPDKVKTPAEIRAEKEAEQSYRRSLGNIPEQKSTDPWGTMRGDGAPKAAAKDTAKAPPARPKATSAEGAAK
ncbi:hypothetical protein [Bradyrhizobium valentinum]|uniref:DUF4148 domain-containing protein n=1 Tax=Bradyrhizobium valentinum TaxID=1518501 RepID=A0A0R3K152_9BRAD|nr:hypothetical protein [Bradyrhizobium valentinum]KRQ89416.1 hypothetical protein CQ10_37725 [Bradyrhizobium valentinum]KRR12897.1 hypothetical protein CP49_16890 [Bradyrhizobium valentinum]